MSDAPELLPCPFCGSDNVGIWTPGSCIVCHACGTEGPVRADHSLSHLESDAAWNRRAEAALLASPAVQALIAAAKAEGMEMAAGVADAQEVKAKQSADKADDDQSDWDGGILFGTEIGARIIARDLRAAAATLRTEGTKP